VVVLLLTLAGPAAAQPPNPPPARQPVPVQPPPPPPVPNFVFPVGPGRPSAGNAPQLVVAKVVDGSLVCSTTQLAPVQRQVETTVIENGEQVRRTVTVTTLQQTTKDTSVPLDGLKVRTAGGKKIAPLTLEIQLGQGAGVVLHTGPLPPEVRALLKDDAILVEMTGGPMFAQPPVFTPVAPAVRPAPVNPPPALPAPTPRP
jgi:hypothetical protein